MGWRRMLLLGNLDQQLDIHDTRAALQAIDQRQRQSGRFDEETSREHQEMRPYYAALARLLVGKGVISHKELARIVAQVDGADGQADGRFSGPLAP